ncbi:NAD(P)/FAD-dependent oxidoreductase [Clostridiales bacterium COT073_COT-073]|nr:NAD(P)/FAD-dependent oxidoreductase [Clostridiales bacterium COT073_COT-073]
MNPKNKWDTVVIGGGPAGCMAAIAAAQNGQKTLLLEKNEKIGKKLYITGKGRCNLTNAVDTEEILKNIPRNSKFLYGAMNAFTSRQLMAFFENAGCPLKVERGNRVFPVSDKSSDILKTLEKELLRNGVCLQKKSVVTDLLTEGLAASQQGDKRKTAMLQRVTGVRLQSGEAITASKVIIAMGGLAYPATGSTGDGYCLVQSVGHSLEEPATGLVPLETVEQDFAELSPMLLKNVGFTVMQAKKVLFADRGEVQFTRFGLSGALALSASSFLPKKIGTDLIARIDLKPALSQQQLEARILREIAAQPNQFLTAALASLLPQRLLYLLFKRCRLQAEKKSGEMTKAERTALIDGLKNLQFHIKGVRGWNEAIITRGGIRVKEVNPKTMESKLVKGLYLAGEILDVDALTGGFNLQIAFSTGYLAGIQALPQ